MTQKEIMQQYKPWVTNEILKSTKIRKKLYKNTSKLRIKISKKNTIKSSKKSEIKY